MHLYVPDTSANMILLITVVVALFIRYFFSQWKYYKSSWTLEGPIALPIIGNGLMLNDMDRKDLPCNLNWYEIKKFTFLRCFWIIYKVAQEF